MPLLYQATEHFSQDIARARAVVTHASTLQQQDLQRDLFRSAWMLSVGALDAYFCDAYADIVARTLQAKQHQASIKLPVGVRNLQIPVFAAIRPSTTDSWRWRMAARGIIERKNILSLKEVKTAFHGFCRDIGKPFGDQVFDSWVLHPTAKVRMLGIAQSDYRRTSGRNRGQIRKGAKQKFDDRFREIIQRRHDCIHNCDRPKMAPEKKGLTAMAMPKVVDDVEFLSLRFGEAMVEDFPQWLKSIGASGVTSSRVLQ